MHRLRTVRCVGAGRNAGAQVSCWRSWRRPPRPRNLASRRSHRPGSCGPRWSRSRSWPSRIMPAGSSRGPPTSRRNSPSAWASCSSRSRSTLPMAASRRSAAARPTSPSRAHARARGAHRFRSGLHGNGDDLIVPGASPIATLEQADQPGRKIVAYERTAVEEMLKKKMTKATIVRVPIWTSGRSRSSSPARPTPSPTCAMPSCPISRSCRARVFCPATTAATRSPSAMPRTLGDRHLREGLHQVGDRVGLVTRAIEKAGVQGAVAPGG